MRTLKWIFAAVLATLTARAYVLYYDASNVYVNKWQTSPVSLQVELSNFHGLSDGNSQASCVLAAMDIWNAQIGTQRLSGTISSGTTSTQSNGLNEIAMSSTVQGQSFGSGVLAVTLISTRGNSFAETDLLFNTAYTWDSYRGSLQYGKQDMRRVAIHELGHVLGLDHPDESNQYVTAIMNSHVSDLDTLAADDIAGGQALYGAPGVLPANDNFASATVVALNSGTLQLSGSNVGATHESGEPGPASTTGQHSVWWKWTAPSKCTLTLTTFGSNFDTVLGVYTGSSVSGLTEVVSNDDEETSDQNSTPSRKRTSKVTFDATAGTAYYVLVDGWGSSNTEPTGYTGTIVLNLSLQSAAPHVTLSTVARQCVNIGQKLDFKVTATGSGSLTYQWFHNGASIPGATDSEYSVASSALADAGYYFVDVTDSDGTSRSSPFFGLVTPSAVQLIGWGDQNAGQQTVPSTVVNPVAISVGTYHALALMPDGTVVAWGTSWSNEANVPSGLTNVVAVAAGGGYSLVLKADGTVVSWGGPPKAGVPDGLNNVVAISAGDYHWLALKSDGSVVSWGEDNDPRIVLPNTFTGATAVAAGHALSLALKPDGTVLQYPQTLYAMPQGLGKAVAIAANSHLLAVNTDGTVTAWGYNDAGQVNVPSGLNNVKNIAAGGHYSVALRSDGTVVSWGVVDYATHSAPPAGLTDVFAISAGYSYCMALRDASNDTVPVITSQPNALTVVESASATFTVVATARSGVSYQWRRNGVSISGATSSSYAIAQTTLGDGGNYDVVVSNHVGSTTSAVASLTVKPLPSITYIGSARQLVALGKTLNLSASVSGTGSVKYQWYKDGRPIDGATSYTLTRTVSGAADAGVYWLVATDDNGVRNGAPRFVWIDHGTTRVAAWGNNAYGLDIVPTGLSNAIAIYSDGSKAVALKSDGTTTVWGYSPDAALAQLYDAVALAVGVNGSWVALSSDGRVTGSGRVATAPAGLSNVAAIACTDTCAVALKTDGTVACWGDSSVSVPAGLTNVVAISAGWYSAYALKADGTVVAWGAFNVTPPPTGLNHVVAISAGGFYALALKDDGSVVGWGNNDYGQLNAPTALRNVQTVSAGDDFSMALKADGTVSAWGNVMTGQTAVPHGLSAVFAICAGGSTAYAIYDVASAPTATPAGCYLGKLASDHGYWGLKVNDDNTANFIAYLSDRHSAVVAHFAVAPDGTFRYDGTEKIAQMRPGLEQTMSVADSGGSAPLATASNFTLRGQISFGSVIGLLDGLNESFVGSVDSTGDSSSSGFYTASALGTAPGAEYTIVSASGQAVAVLATSVMDGIWTSANAGKISTTTTTGGQLDLSLDPGNHTATGTFTPGGSASAISFAGLAEGVASTARLVNIASRADGGTGNNVAIGGFGIAGSGTKRLLLRAVGPTLATQGLGQAEVMADPTIELHDALNGNRVVTSIDNWGDNADPAVVTAMAATVGAAALSGSDAKSAATLLNLPPGVYTFVASGKNATSGIVLIEVYDADGSIGAASLVNISTRAYCSTGNNVTIGGFAVNGNAPKHLLLRAVGPTLATQGLGVGEVLADPVIEVHDTLHNNAVVATNDNWGDNANASDITTTGARVGATPLATGDTKSSAMLITLQPGVYSFVASGKNGTSGIVLVEVYDAD